MGKTLYGKLAVLLFALFLLIGLFYVGLTWFTTRHYIQEVDQRLHRQLASYLVSKNLFIRNGKADEGALKKSFEVLMHINPNIELYLLNPEGEILAYSAPPGRVVRDVISLEPVAAFLAGGERALVWGDDPRDRGRRKVFSAAPIPEAGPREGYLYIILGSEAYESVAQMFQSSYIFRLSAAVAVAGLCFVFIAALFLFGLLTRRLRTLTVSMRSFRQSDFSQPVDLSTRARARRGDEIDQLGRVFQAMAERISSQINEIRRIDRMRRELVSNVSHDLRTPLTSMQGYLETLLLKQESMSPEERQRYLSTAIQHARRLGSLVTELFELAKLEAEEIKIHPEPFHLGELISDITDKVRLEAERRQIRLQTDFHEPLPFVYADVGLIERAVQNLLDNALRYTPEGGEVHVKLSPRASRMVVEVSDNGVGIREEDLPQIFNRFYRPAGEEKSSASGAGLGLAITKRILELHKSSIEVLSELNLGTTFTFELPLHATA